MVCHPSSVTRGLSPVVCHPWSVTRGLPPWSVPAHLCACKPVRQVRQRRSRRLPSALNDLLHLRSCPALQGPQLLAKCEVLPKQRLAMPLLVLVLQPQLGVRS